MAPSTVSSQDQGEPLLPSKPLEDHQDEPLSPTSALAVKVLAIHRIALGAVCTVAPQWSCALFQFPIPAAYSITPRIFGIRDLAIGELLLTAEDKSSPNRGRREIKRALWLGIGVDLVDIASIVYGVATGTFPRDAALIFGSGAATSVALGAFCLRGL